MKSQYENETFNFKFEFGENAKDFIEANAHLADWSFKTNEPTIKNDSAHIVKHNEPIDGEAWQQEINERYQLSKRDNDFMADSRERQ